MTLSTTVAVTGLMITRPVRVTIVCFNLTCERGIVWCSTGGAIGTLPIVVTPTAVVASVVTAAGVSSVISAAVVLSILQN